MGHPLFPIFAVILFNVVVSITVILYIDRVHRRTVAQIKNGFPKNGHGRMERIRELTESLKGSPPDHSVEASSENDCPMGLAEMIENCEPTVVKFNGKLEDIYVLVVHRDS